MIRLLSALKLKTTKKLLASLDPINKLDRRTTREKKKRKENKNERMRTIDQYPLIERSIHPPIP